MSDELSLQVQPSRLRQPGTCYLCSQHRTVRCYNRKPLANWNYTWFPWHFNYFLSPGGEGKKILTAIVLVKGRIIQILCLTSRVLPLSSGQMTIYGWFTFLNQMPVISGTWNFNLGIEREHLLIAARKLHWKYTFIDLKALSSSQLSKLWEAKSS